MKNVTKRRVLVLTMFGCMLLAAGMAYTVRPVTPAGNVSAVLTGADALQRQREIREKEQLRPEAGTSAELLQQQAAELAEIQRWHATRTPPAR